jgi:outer membrane murein-binding lipoprotein Lpp
MKSALLVGTLLLVGCSSTNGAVLPTVQGKFDQLPTPEQIAEDIKDKRVEINQFVYNDILRAQEIALEPPVDQVAAACYPALAAKVKKRMDGNSTNAIGAISAFEESEQGVVPIRCARRFSEGRLHGAA